MGYGSCEFSRGGEGERERRVDGMVDARLDGNGIVLEEVPEVVDAESREERETEREGRTGGGVVGEV